MGSLLEWANAVAGLKLMPDPRLLKGRLATWANLSGAARSRPVPGETTHSSRMWALARAGVKTMTAPVGPAALTAVTVTTSLFAGVPTVILLPVAKPSTLRTKRWVAPAPTSVERLV